MKRRTFGLVGVLILFSTGCGAVIPWAERADRRAQVRKVGTTAAAALNPTISAFRDLGVAAGLDPHKIYIGGLPVDVINAASLGENHFLITRGFQRMTNSCVIWGIVAHELAHDVLGHSEKRATLESAVGAVPIPLFAAVAAAIVKHVALSAYSRGHERDADAKAVELLDKAGKPKWAARYALEFLKEAHGDTGGGWVSTHPLTSERIEQLPTLPDPEAVAATCASPERRANEIASEREAWRALKQRQAEEETRWKDDPEKRGGVVQGRSPSGEE